MRKRDAEIIKQMDGMSWDEFERAELELSAKYEAEDAHVLTDNCIERLTGVNEFIHLHERRMRQLKKTADSYSAEMKKAIEEEVARTEKKGGGRVKRGSVSRTILLTSASRDALRDALRR